MRLWKQAILQRLAAGEIRSWSDSPRSIFAPLYLITMKSYEDSANAAMANERQRIIKILETTGAEFLTTPELQELLDLICKDN